MAGWNDGYVTDVDYTSKFLRETTPSWLAAAALLAGQRPPDLGRPFHYADLGCGHGLTAIIVAATCPHADVWGFDFNPAHIESGRLLAERAGLTNVTFRETSFADLAALPDAALPAFDFVVAHGVISWISPDNQHHLVQAISRLLRPGGLAYLSYNVATGWGAMQPLRVLMRLLTLAAGDRTDRSTAGVLDYLDGMKHAGAGFFTENPALDQRLEDIRRQDPRYIAHEFLNQDWHPLMFAEVADRMTRIKCSYIGSATLSENISAVTVPPGMADLMTTATDPVLRETLRDFAVAQSFRRDIYRKGVLALPAAEHVRLLDAMQVEWTGRPIDDPMNPGIHSGGMLEPPVLLQLLANMPHAVPAAFGALRQHPTLAGVSAMELRQAVSLLVSNGYLHPVLHSGGGSGAHRISDRINREIGAINADGGNIEQLASPVLGSMVKADILETLAVREKLADATIDIDTMTELLLPLLHQLGRLPAHDGIPIQARAVLRGSLEAMSANRLPLFKRLGIM